MRRGETHQGVAACLAVCIGWTSAPGMALARTTRSAGAAVVVTTAPADDAEVEAYIARAVEQYKAGNFEGAIESFEAAYALNPEPNYLFNIGRVYEDMGNPTLAVEYYERFVAEPEVDAAAREVAQGRLDELRPGLEAAQAEATKAEPVAEEEPEPVVEPERPERVDEEPRADDSRPGRSFLIAGGTLLGVGLAALGAGGGVAGSALAQSRALDGDLDTLEERNDAIDKGETRAAVADGLFVAGGVVAATGLALLIVGLRRKRSRQQARWVPSIGPRGASMRFEYRF